MMPGRTAVLGALHRLLQGAQATVVFATSATGWRIVLGGDVREAGRWFQSFLDFFFAVVIARRGGCAY
jgi:hypothetical protein